MSCIRYYDDIPHIVRFGMQSRDDEKCWIRFWRSGVGFWLFVDGQDVQADRRFYEQWRDMLERKRLPGEPLVKPWLEFCDHVIPQAMDLLRELAPANLYWHTLQDYLHCPRYKIRLRADQANDSTVKAFVLEGPDDLPAYSLWPTTIAESGLEFPSDPPRYTSADLQVVDREDDWRQPPHRVRAPDGQYYKLKTCDKGSRHHMQSEIINHSLETICAQLRIHRQWLNHNGQAAWPCALPKLCAIVIDQPKTSIEQPEVASSRIPSQSKETPDSLLVGVLLSDTPRAKSLQSYVRDAVSSNRLTPAQLTANAERWKSRLLTNMEQLHALGFYLSHKESGGGTQPIYFVHSVLIDEREEAWYDVSGALKEARDDGTDPSEVADYMRNDLSELQRVFDKWLPEELSKLTRET